MKKRILSIVLSIVMLVGLLPTTAWAGELDPIVRSCTCGASADADGVILHVSDCPLYEATANESQAADPECTCGAVPDEDGVTSHEEDCPLYAGLEEEPEEEPAEELAAPAVLERPYDEETSSDTVLYVDGQWDTYCWEIYTDNTFGWTVYADTAEIIVDKETYVASAFRCTVTLGDQSAVTEPAAYNTELIKPTVSLLKTKMASNRSAHMVLTKAASVPNSGRSAYMVWTKDDSVFNIRGLDGSYEFQTTFMNKGYRSWIKVDDTSRAGTGGQLRDGLTYDITPSLVYGGRYVKITYTVVNTGSKTYTFRIGSAADVMIDDNDRAPVVGLTGGGGLVMRGSPRNTYKFNLVAPSADTLWYGYWIEASKNVFNDREDKTTEYDKDSGMAWSWKDEVIKPGQTWERSVLIGVGELPVAPDKPRIPDMPEFVAGKDGIISGTATPGDTVYVTIDGEEYSATAENGNFSINVSIPAEQPDNTLDVTYYAVSPEGGISEITSVKVNVATPPRIVLKQSELTLMEEDPVPTFNSFIADSAGEVSITSTAVNTNVPGTYTVTYTASVPSFDPATACLTVTVVPKPAELTAASCTHGSASFDLTATMTYTGGNTYTETGFVYAPYHYPTLTDDRAGKVETSSPVNTKGGTLSASVEDSALIYGVNYYARPYAKFGDTVIYGGESANFGLGVPNYGSVQIENNGNNIFTVSRTGGSNGQQIVHFRTVNGSAVGGTHFTHQTGTVTIPDGATTAGTTISIAELGVNQTYGGEAATAYSNADRTYQVEIYLVEGGASIGTGKATRTMTKNGGYVIDRTIYSEWKEQTKSDEAHRGDYDDDRLGWKENAQGYGAQEKIKIADTPGFSQRDYWMNTADAIKFRLQFSAKEVEAGYQHIQITPGQSLDLQIHPYDGDWRGNRSTTLYVATFEHGGSGGANKNYATYFFPVASGSNTYTPSERFYGTQDGNQYVRLPVDTEYVSVGYSGSGSKSDEWMTKDQHNRFMLKDTKEPQLLGIAPMADTTYVPGQQMTLALIFDEIVDRENSALAGLNSGTVLNVDWNNDNNADASFNYAGGLNTNVLYFTCILPETMNVTGEHTLKLLNNDLSAKIKDMCSTGGSASAVYAGKTVTVKFDSTTPSVDVSVLSTDEAGFTSGTITASNFTRLEYVWSQNSTSPVAGWERVDSGTTVRTRQTEGTWYLYARATNDYGRTATAAKAITFAAGGSGGTPVVLPELKVSVDNTTWVKEQREIRITTRQPNAATVAVTKPEGSKETVSGNTYTATTNGIYTFTLTSGSETITKMVNVARIDYNAPAVAIEDLTNFTHTAAVTLTVTAADTESGLAATPLSGVWKNGTEEVAATFTSAGDGVWTTTSPDKTGSWVLTVTATDAVGRTSSDTSETYTIHAERPAITISNRKVTNAGITYDYAVQENGNGGVTVTLPDGTTTTALTGTVLLTEPGSYYIFVTDALGHYVQSAEMTVPQSTPENPVDYTAPDVRYDTDPYVWTNADAVTITLNIVEEHGLSSVTYRKPGETTETVIDISGVSADADDTYTTSFTVTENGTYTVTAKDKKGNAGTMDVVVDFIDRTDPDVSFDGTFGQWMKAEQTITLRPADPDVDGDNEDASGVDEVEYAVSADKTAVPDALTVLENPYQVTISENGTWYIYYEITDNAGNVATGWSEAVKVDKVTPVIAVDTSAAMTGAGEQTVSVAATFGVSGGAVKVGGDTVLTMESTTQSGTYTEKRTNTYVIRAEGVYDFVATSAAGKTASQAVTVYGIDFDSNGGNEVANQIVVSGGKATAPETITRTGYTFGGWYKEQACTTAWDFNTDTVSGATTLYAKWTEKASVSIIETAQTYTWDGNPKSFAITGTPNNEFTVQYKVNDNWTTTAPSAVGTYDVRITRAEDDTYKAYEKTITGGLVIKAATPAATPPSAISSLVYNGSAQELINAGTSDHGYWKYSLDDTSYSSDIPTGTDAKTYTVYCRFVPNTGYANIDTVELSVTIDPMAVNEPSVTGTYTYTGEEQTATVTGKADYMTETGAVKGTNAGDYTITYTLDENHCWANGSDGEVTWSIGKANYDMSGVSFSGATTTYDGSEHKPAVSGTLPTGKDNIQVTVSYSDGQTTVGETTVTATFATTSTNYNVPSVKTAKQTITAAEITNISVSQTGTLTYTGQPQTATVSTSATTVNSQTASFTYFDTQNGTYTASVPAFTDAGNHTVYYKVTAPNHGEKSGSFTVSIGKASLTVTAKAKSISYGDAAANDGVEYSGFVNGETSGVLGGTLNYAYGTYTTGSPVGTYDIVPSGLTSDNYEITFTKGKLTVAAKQIAKPTAAEETYTYNGKEQSFKFVDGTFDAGTMNITGNKQTNANETGYTVTVTPKANYAWSTEGECKFTWKIGRKTAELQWTTPTNLVYSHSAKEPKVAVTNLINGDKCNVSAELTTANGNINVGTFTFTATALSNDNYTLPENATSPEYTIVKADQALLSSKVFTTTYDADHNPVIARNTEDKREDNSLITYEVSADKSVILESMTLTAGQTYYVRKGGNDNYKPSNWVAFTVPAQAQYTVRLSSTGGGSIAVMNGGVKVNNNTKVYTGTVLTLSATPANNFGFTAWYANDVKLSGTTYTVTGDVTLKAVFTRTGYDTAEVPTPANFTYDGKEHTGFTVPVGAHYTAAGTLSATKAGAYSVTFKLKEGCLWEDGTSKDKALTWKISKAGQAKPVLSPAQVNVNNNVTVTSSLENLKMVSPSGTVTAVNQNTITPDQVGLYEFYYAGDANHYPSGSVLVRVVAPITVKTQQPTDITKDSAVLHGTVTGTGAPANVSYEYGKAGTNDKTTVGSGSISGLTADTEYSYRAFVTVGGKTYYGETVTFRTAKELNKPTGKIDVTVELSEAASGTLSVESGNTVIKSVEFTTTDNKATAAFEGLPDGYYNVVLRVEDYVETRMIAVENGQVQTVNFFVPEGSLRTIVEVLNPETPKVAVEGLGSVIEAQNQASDTDVSMEAVARGEQDVEVSLSVEKNNEAEGKDSINYALGSGEKLDTLLDISLLMTVSNYEVTDTERTLTGMEKQDIGKTNQSVLEIVIPYNTNGGTTMYRYHDGVSEKLTKLSARPVGDFADGTYYVDNGYIFLYASGFSTYAIAETEVTHGGHGGNTNVISAPTGDMGVALYAGLAISSLLGIGWLGKKKRDDE